MSERYPQTVEGYLLNLSHLYDMYIDHYDLIACYGREELTVEQIESCEHSLNMAMIIQEEINRICE